MKFIKNKPVATIMALGLLLGLSIGKIRQQNLLLHALQDAPELSCQWHTEMGFSGDISFEESINIVHQDAALEENTERLLREMAILQNEYEAMLREREVFIQERINWMRTHRVE